MDGATAQASRYYHHVINGGTLNERDVARMVEAMEAKDAEIARLTAALERAVSQVSDLSTKLGRAEGKLLASETHGVVEGWKRRAEAAEALLGAAYRAGRYDAAAVSHAHLTLVQPHHPDEDMPDLVAQGYGNAALNIAAAIRALPVPADLAARLAKEPKP